ncbi:MAG: hypothetical protein FWC97_08050 [Treponema sp.]|nr:hypothetical protein [Treponema sp.]
MKKIKKIIGIAVIAAVIGFAATACKEADEEPVIPGTSALTGTVSITGIAGLGQELTANTEALSGSGTITYQWMRDGENITGATSSVYFTRNIDLDSTISVRVSRSCSTGERVSEPTTVIIRPVSGITGGTQFATVGISQTLSGTSVPENANNRTIYWNVKDAGTTGAVIKDNILSTTSTGTVTVTATVPDGLAEKVDFYQDFTITVLEIGDFDQWVTRVNFTAPTETIHLHNLQGQNIYLAKINISTSQVNAQNTGNVLNVVPTLTENFSHSPIIRTIEEERPIMGRPPEEGCLFDPTLLADEIALARVRSEFIAPDVGDTRDFWVEFPRVNSRSFVSREAVLMATGEHGNIWVMYTSYDSNHNPLDITPLITQERADFLAEKFDIIYPATTNIFGFEYGGRPGHPSYPGGRDSDPKVQILVYDIGGGIAGFFWSKDHNPAPGPANLRSNQAEIFYIDANLVMSRPYYALETLTHELQHMIHFNEKRLERNLQFSASWFNEMLSMMAQCIIADLVGTPIAHRDHIVQAAMPSFIVNYANEGLTEWGTPNPMGIPVATWLSYATKYAFGAFLLRNFGGAELLRNIANNSSNDISSISEALNELEPGLTFNEALIRFSESFIFSGENVPPGVKTFDNTVTRTIGEWTYTSHAFDIWEMHGRDTQGRTLDQTGPTIFDLTQRAIRQHSVNIHSADVWKNLYGSHTVTLQRPTNPNIVFVLMAR